MENQTKRLRLLLVDDEKQFVEVMTQRLTKRNYSVVPAFSGEEALERLEEDSPIEVVVLDVKMPGRDGIATLKAIKKRHPLVEVILLTGHSTVKSAVAGIKLGAFDYLMKPCDIDLLLSKLEGAAARKRHHENQIRQVQTKPYISRREKDALISEILEAATSKGPA
ncbi:MAG: response regulator [Desulfobacterales bacterium]|nr:MAG: response regulator [Desulfobacterales bacterium]